MIGILWYLQLDIFPMNYSKGLLLGFQHLIPTSLWGLGTVRTERKYSFEHGV